MLRRLCERGIVPDLLVGSSVGRSESGLCSNEIPLKAETWPLTIDDHQRTGQESVETPTRRAQRSDRGRVEPGPARGAGRSRTQRGADRCVRRAADRPGRSIQVPCKGSEPRSGRGVSASTKTRRKRHELTVLPRSRPPAARLLGPADRSLAATSVSRHLIATSSSSSNSPTPTRLFRACTHTSRAARRARRSGTACARCSSARLADTPEAAVSVRFSEGTAGGRKRRSGPHG
jgi:hypothetical protein